MKDKCRKMFSYFQKLNRQILIVIYCRIQCYNESYVRLATNCKDIKLRNGPNQNILMILSCQLGGYAEICIAFLQICFHGETNWTSLIYSPFSTAFELISSLCTISSLEFNFRTNSHLSLEAFLCLFASSSAIFFSFVLYNVFLGQFS